jgi:hypothetical protein
MDVDENGCPIELDERGMASKECPPTPCKFCEFGSPVDWDGSNFAWCRYMKTCAATIDWDKALGSQ